MDRIAFSLRLGLAALFAAAPSHLLAVTPSTQASGRAIVLRPLSLIKKTDMDFGTLITSATAGTATIDPVSGAVTTAGGVTAVPTSTTAAAAFVGAGSRKAPVIIRIPKNPIALTRSGGTETVTLTNWTLDGAATRLIGANQAFQFQVGGQLSVGANQTPGTYIGTFAVTVQYP
jgi:spore coat protein U-like protein